MRLDVPDHLWRTAQRDHEEWVTSAVALLDLLARAFDRPDLADTSVLDVGCGTKFTKVILEQEIPIRRYVGVDAAAEVIDFLRANVDDPRFSFHHVDAQNDLYNAEGRPLDSFPTLPVGDETFDIICLFSVFTHLAPHDYRVMLEMLRPHVAADGGLLFSLFVERDLDPAVDAAIGEHLQSRVAAGDADAVAAIERELARRQALDADGYVDCIPSEPLWQAGYTESRARELIEGTGWRAVALHPPEPPYVQHYFVCRPE